MKKRSSFGSAAIAATFLLAQAFGPILNSAIADDQEGPSIEEIRQLNQNPVSGLRSIYLQNVIGTIHGEVVDGFSIQPVWPFPVGDDWKLITYTIIPFIHLPALRGQDSASGLGNILFNGFFRPEKMEGPITWGLGPAIQLPTRSDHELGSNRVSAGPAALLYGVAGPASGGLVLQNYWSLGGSGANRVNTFSGQYFVNYNLPKGWFLETSATIESDWTADPGNRWIVPLGGGFGNVFQIGHGKLFYSASIQGFGNVVRPDPAPSWTVIAQFQIIFSLQGKCIQELAGYPEEAFA